MFRARFSRSLFVAPFEFSQTREKKNLCAKQSRFAAFVTYLLLHNYQYVSCYFSLCTYVVFVHFFSCLHFHDWFLPFNTTARHDRYRKKTKKSNKKNRT